MLCVFDGLIVAGASCFDDIVMVFGVSFEGNFGIAICAFEVEAEDFDPKVGFFVANFHSHVEFGADVEVISAGVAP